VATAQTERPEVKILQGKFAKAIRAIKVDRDQLFVCVTVDSLLDVIAELKHNPDLQYDYFSECLGVDYSRWEHSRDMPERFEVVYNLMSTKSYSRIFVKVAVNDGQKIPTLMHLFAGAEYPEKEIGDLFGILFEGNELPKGERFMLPDDWAGFPLRKEYPLGGEDVLFDQGYRGPAVEDVMMPHAGETFEGKTGSEEVSGR